MRERFIEVRIEAASQDACAASRVEHRRAESELRALLVEGPDDAGVIKLRAQTTAVLLKAESEPGAAKARASDAAAGAVGVKGEGP